MQISLDGFNSTGPNDEQKWVTWAWDEINKLKKQCGKDIIVYGGSSFVADLAKEKLIDKFFLFVNPVALGKVFRFLTS